jgi:hypothetical protein
MVSTAKANIALIIIIFLNDLVFIFIKKPIKSVNITIEIFLERCAIKNTVYTLEWL